MHGDGGQDGGFGNSILGLGGVRLQLTKVAGITAVIKGIQAISRLFKRRRPQSEPEPANGWIQPCSFLV
jgi:hypothetical protein